MKEIEKIKVPSNTPIKKAIKQMDEGGIGLICVLDENEKVIGVVSDGDFRRAILNEIDLNNSIIEITNKSFKYLFQNSEREDIDRIFKSTVANKIPILNSDFNLLEVITEDEFYGIKSEKLQKKTLDCEVVIMAGGKGTRLDPFTRILPKPLIPIGNKTILEVIIEKFINYNSKNFYLSVNHKAQIIKSYFEEIKPDYKIIYLNEEKPLGTVGALKQLESKLNREILLTNCDIIIDADYSDLLKYHKDQKNDITIVASLKHYNIPYGICEIENGGKLVNIKEKPEYDLLINTGMYVINPCVLKYIPQNEFFHITHLIEKIKSTHKVGVYPISENAWIDTGEWVEYKKALQVLKV